MLEGDVGSWKMVDDVGWKWEGGVGRKKKGGVGWKLQGGAVLKMLKLTMTLGMHSPRNLLPRSLLSYF